MSSSDSLQEWNKQQVRPPCPKCGEEKEIIVVVHGRPSGDLVELAMDKKNLVRLGGCSMGEDRACGKCGHTYAA